MGDDVADRKLFVAKLPEDIREDEMKIVFNTYGKVSEVIMLGPERSRQGQRCGFVIYETPEAARAAVQVLDNVYKFRPEAPEAIHVAIARPRGNNRDKGDKGGDKGGGKGYDQGYGKGGGGGYDQGYGRGGGGGGGWGGGGGGGYNQGGYNQGYNNSYDSGGYDRGGGGSWGGDRGYNNGGGYDNRDRGNYSSGGGGNYSSGGGGNYSSGGGGGRGGGDSGGGGGKGRDDSGQQGTKLYVGNLPGDIQKDALEIVFNTYGSVADIHIMTGKSKSGQACAFLRYNNMQEAKSAIAAMQQGYEIRPGEGNIIVKLADGPAGKGSGGRSGPY